MEDMPGIPGSIKPDNYLESQCALLLHISVHIVVKEFVVSENRIVVVQVVS